MYIQVNSQAEALLVLNQMDLLHLKAEDEVWGRLKDNRDMSTMVSWDPKEMEVPQTAVKESFNLEVMFARCRHILLRFSIKTTLSLRLPYGQIKVHQLCCFGVRGPCQCPAPSLY